MKKIFIGTSGWSYAHWKENFYPAGLKTNSWLNFYSQEFPTVEVNTSFYGLPTESTLKNWNSQVPKNFIFSLKLSRYITHMKRLKDCKDSLDYFYKRIQLLESKVGPILIQLPPSFVFNEERINNFIKILDKDYKYVIEFRNPSWYIDKIYEILNKNKIALCITDLNGTLSPEVITSNFTYIRLHGPKEAYKGTYGLAKLKKWKTKLQEWSKKKEIYCYFDNDEKGYAIEDAITLKGLL